MLRAEDAPYAPSCAANAEFATRRRCDNYPRFGRSNSSRMGIVFAQLTGGLSSEVVFPACTYADVYETAVTSTACNPSRAKLTEDGQNEATNRIAFRCGGETDRRWKLQFAKCGGVTHRR